MRRILRVALMAVIALGLAVDGISLVGELHGHDVVASDSRVPVTELYANRGSR